MHCTSDGELDVTVLRIGFVDYLAIDISTAKKNLLSIGEGNGGCYFFGADFAEEVFPLLKVPFLGTVMWVIIHLATVFHGFDAPC